MDEMITVADLVRLGIIIMGIWGFYKVIMEIVKQITSRHDREQKWDEMASSINEERLKIVERYDARLSEMEKKIEDNYTETEARLQQIYSEQYVLTDCMSAVLDGLVQLGCNNKVTQAKENLDKYMNAKAHEMNEMKKKAR